MGICLRLTSIATLLLGLQLLSPKMLPIQAEFSLLQNNTSNHLLLASSSIGLQDLAMIEQSNQEDFTPPDNGHPKNTRGSGTR